MLQKATRAIRPAIVRRALAVWGLCLASAVASAAGPLPKVRIAPDGRGFQTADGKPFAPMGVNYFRPGTGWAPQLWKQFDADATRRDFARMKEIGVNCVRVFLSYGSFFTEPDSLRSDGIAKLDRLLDIAETAGIYIHPTGPDHWEGLPPWASGDRVADERVLAALENFWKQLAARYRGRGALFAYDLLNEPSVSWDTPVMRTKWNRWLASRYGSAEKAAQAWRVRPEALRWGEQPPPAPKALADDPQLLDYQRFREEIADQWTRRQVAAIKSADPEALVTVGFIQWSVPAVLPGVQHYAAFRPDRQAPLLDFLEVHFYPLARGFYTYAGEEDELRNLAYLECVVREVAAPGKPVVLAEFGWYGGGKLTINRGTHPPATEEQQAAWCRHAIETTEGLATGWLNWGLYDHPQARDVTQLTGLWTVEGKPKAWSREFQALAGRLSSARVPPRQLGPRPKLDWDRAITDPKALDQFREEYLRAFRASRVSGRPDTH
ncbi:MAG: beta-galactosidase [Thermoguttaceae bacterium]|nr:beta-galactosidase [Thermoguttaceae bacterium]